MELLGLLAVLFFLYLLIAPAVAWVRASNAATRGEEVQQTVERQARELKTLTQQLNELRIQQQVLQGRLNKLSEVPSDLPVGATAPTPVVKPPALGASTPPPVQRRAPAAVPAAVASVAAESTQASAEVFDPAASSFEIFATDSPPAATENPATPPHSQWNLEPPGPEVPAVADKPVPRSSWNETRPAHAASQSTPRSSGREPVWTPKPPVARAPVERPPHQPSAFETQIAGLLQAARGWLFGGNLVAKIGLMILFIGVAFLLRLASNYVTVPIEVRLAAIAAGAIALLGWGWHIRNSRPGIALPAQGAALATLMLVTFGAFKLYHLLPSTPTFGLLLLLVAFTCVLAVLQDALWLAVFGIVGGFAVPILTATGGGSHIALFSYYALLNAGILAIAWRRSWRSLNLLGFLFTFVIGTLWGVQRYEPEHYASAQFFLVLFLVFYVAIAVLYAWRQAPRFKLYVDATLVFGVPTVAMGLQYGLVKDMHLGTALSALGLGLFYASVAAALWRWRKGNLRLLVESFFALAMVFGTLAIPLAFDGRWTSAAWALEGAGVVWVGLRQRQALVWRFGMLVQFGSWIAFIRALTGLDPIAALNGHISLGFILLGATGVFLALVLRGQSNSASGDTNDQARQRFARFASAFIGIAVIWLLAGMWVEIWLRVHGAQRAGLFVLTAIGLVFGLQWLARRADWRVPDLLAGAVTAVAGLTFLGLMSRYMDWHNISVYAETSLAELLANSALLGGLLLSGGALVSAFAFKRQMTQLDAEVADSSSAFRSTVAWFLLALFWWCGFALHGAAHAVAWLTSPVAGDAVPWYQISFWAAYSIGLALSAWGATALTRRFDFPNRDYMQRLIWPTLTTVAGWIYLIQVSPGLAIDHSLEFSWAPALPGAGEFGDVLFGYLGGPLLGTLILAFMTWLGARRLRSAESATGLSDSQRSSGVAIWLIGLAVVVNLLLVDGLALLSSQLLSSAGAVSGDSLSWLSYADLRLVWMAAAAVLLVLASRLLRFPELRWLALPTAAMQALASVEVLARLYQRAQLPTPGTGVALLFTWLAMAWCLRQWQQIRALPEAALKALHFGRIIAPWLMLAPVVSLNLMPWLVGETPAIEFEDQVWVVAGMWPDYIAAWLALGALFLGLRQVRGQGWPLTPLHAWYGRVVIPVAGFWASLLVLYWNLRQDGGMAPLPYLPILNPLDLTTGFVALLWADLWRMYRQDIVPQQRRELLRTSMALAFGWFNLMLLRTAAQYLGLPYRFDPLFQSQFVQAMLSLVWTLCAFGLMRYAARKLSKPLWMVGAGLLGVVVLKLFLIDLKNVGSVAQVVSFMGVGGLMLLIGYLAPLPREAEENRE
jgi:uncharacterized membrane protein